MDYRPRLRDSVLVERSDEGAVLIDEVIGRRIELEPNGAAFVGRLDGRPLDEALQGPGDEITFRRLCLLNAVDGAGAAIVDKVGRVRNGDEPLGISLLDGARFECQGSGECCQNYVFGPLEDADIERLNALDLKTAFPHLEPPYVAEIQRDDGGTMKYLRSVEDRCIFLEEDLKCGIHRRFGAAAKPKLCRLYPLEFFATADGLRVYDKGSCATFAVSARRGLPLVDDLERIRGFLPQTASALVHPVVSIDEYSCDFGHFDRFAKFALKLVKRGVGNGPETLRALGRGLRHLAGALRSFPFEPGQPDAAIDALLGGDLAAWYQGEPDVEEVRAGAYRLSQMFSALLVGVSGVIGQSTRAQGYLSERLLREAAQLFHIASVLPMKIADPTVELDPYFGAMAEVSLDDPEIHEVLRLSLRQQLFGLECLVENHALAGFLRMVLTQVLAVAGARLRAVNEGRKAAVAADLSYGHMLAARVLRRNHAAPLLINAEAHFSPILEAMPAIIKMAV